MRAPSKGGGRANLAIVTIVAADRGHHTLPQRSAPFVVLQRAWCVLGPERSCIMPGAFFISEPAPVLPLLLWGGFLATL
jgi:hypothetical protein